MPPPPKYKEKPLTPLEIRESISIPPKKTLNGLVPLLKMVNMVSTPPKKRGTPPQDVFDTFPVKKK